MAEVEGFFERLFERFKFFFKKRGYFKELESSCPDGRGLAASRFGEMRYPEAVPALIETLQDESPYVRSCAVQALGEIGDARAVGPLIGVLNDTNLNVRDEAVEALGKIAEKAEVDLVKIRSMFQGFVRQKDPGEREKAKILAAGLYAKMAKAVSERRGKDMGGVLSDGTVPKRSGKKGKMYRTRKGFNG